MSVQRVAACQIDPQLGEVEANLARISRGVADAAAAGAVLAVLPEAAVTGYAFASLDEGRAVARRASVVAGDAVAGLAQQHGLTVICGTLEAVGDEVFNAALMATPDGRRHTYRKMHLPFLGIDRYATPGPDAASVVEVDGLLIGILICYDLRFPEAARICALDGADLIVVPTNWPIAGNSALFVPARAMENHCYLLACDRVGTERSVTYAGRSVLVDYDGKQLVVASDDREELLLGEIDPQAARQTHVRRLPGEHEWDTMADRRPGLYRRLLEPAVDRQHPPSANLWSGDVE